MPKIRTIQPDVPVGIDWSNPLTRGLVLADNPLAGFNEVDGKYPVSFATKRVPAASGVAYSCESSSSLVHNYSYSPAPSSDTTVFLLVTPDAIPTVPTVLAAHSCAESNSGMEIELSSGEELGTWISTGGEWTEYLSGISLSTGLEVPVVVSHNNTSGETTFYTGNSKASITTASGIPARDCLGVSCYLLSGTPSGFNDSTVTLLLMWERILDDHEARAVIGNPWQVFASQRAYTVPVSVQIARPVADVAAGSWLPSSGSDLYATVDETVSSDADYIYATSATTCTLALASVSDPSSSSGHILRYRLLSGSGTIAVALKQGSTTIATWGPHTLTGAAQDFAQTLTGGQADSITDYSALRVEFTSA